MSLGIAFGTCLVSRSMTHMAARRIVRRGVRRCDGRRSLRKYSLQRDGGCGGWTKRSLVSFQAAVWRHPRDLDVECPIFVEGQFRPSMYAKRM